MDITEAIEQSKRKRDLFAQDVFVLKDNDGKYFSVLSSNLNTLLSWDGLTDKTIYYSAWIWNV